MRDFKFLIREIEFEGKTIIPIQEVAKLAFNYNEQTVECNSRKWVNDSYDCCAWYTFETGIMKTSIHKCLLSISRNFDISINHKINEDSRDNIGMPAHNQVEIFRLLQRLGFIK